MKKQDTKYVISKDGTKIAYDVTGSGPVMIYITGATCFRNFFPILDDVKILSKNLTVYNYDRRGRGDSSDTMPYSIEKEIEDLEALIQVVGSKVFLYGHSSGAILALNAALKLRKTIEKIVVYDPPYVHTEKEKFNYQDLAKNVLIKLSEGKNKHAMRKFLVGIGMPKFFVWLLPLFPGWKTMHTLAPTLAYDIELSKDYPPIELFRKIHIPTLVLVGSKSPERIRTSGTQIAAAISNSDFKEMQGQDHMVSAKALLPILVQFFGGDLQ